MKMSWQEGIQILLFQCIEKLISIRVVSYTVCANAAPDIIIRMKTILTSVFDALFIAL